MEQLNKHRLLFLLIAKPDANPIIDCSKSAHIVKIFELPKTLLNP